MERTEVVSLNMRQPWPRKYLFLTLLVVVSATFGNCLVNGFVWDDTILFLYNRVYREFDLSRILLTAANGVEYLPVRDLSVATDFAIWGERPFGFHLTNLLLYLFNVLAVYWLTAELVPLWGDRENVPARLPFLTALLFALHPLHCEVVDFITCRNMLLCGLFFLLSCVLYLRFQRSGGQRALLYYLGALLACLAAFLSKANAVSLPLVLLFFTLLGRSGTRKRSPFRLIPFFLIALIFTVIFLRIGTQAGVIGNGMASTDAGYWQEKIATALQIPYFYLYKLLIPLHLGIHYDPPFSASIVSWQVASAILLGCALGYAVKRSGKHRAVLGVGLAWYILNLLPVLNLLPTNPVLADRYAYLSSFAFCLVMAYAICSLRVSSLATTLMILIATWWGVVSLVQNRVWKNEQTLFEHAVIVAPNSARMHSDLGRIYFFQTANYDKALEEFAKAQQINPDDPNLDFFQGFLALNLRHDLSGARSFFGRALFKNPDMIEALYYMGTIFEDANEPERAAYCYRKALESPQYDVRTLKPKAREGLNRLGQRVAP